MFFKIIYGSIIALIISSIALILILLSYLFNANNYIINLSKNIMFNIMSWFYIKGCESPILYTGKYKKTNKIDVIIGNHITNFDFALCISLIRQHDNRNIYIIYQRELIFLPILGSFGTINDIGLYFKNLKNSKKNIINSINNIKEGVLIIMPEGVIKSNKFIEKSIEFSKKNNLHVFNNLLYPRIKGLWLIYNTLKKQNKMGNIIDISIVIENFNKKQINMLDMLTKKFGNTYLNIKTLKINNNKINKYEDFKLWFIKKWELKDNILNNMLSFNKYNYIILKPKIEIKYYLLIIIIILLFLFLVLYTKGLYLLFSIIILYIIILINNKINFIEIYNFIKFMLNHK